jgi:hypothetical protein
MDGLVGDLGSPSMPVLIHPEFWSRRRVALPGRVPLELPSTSKNALQGAGFEIVEERQPSFLLDGSLLVTGEVDRTTDFERGFPGHEAQHDGEWRPDPTILDDQALIASVRGSSSPRPPGADGRASTCGAADGDVSGLRCGSGSCQRAAAIALAPRRRLRAGETRTGGAPNTVSAHQRTFSGSIPVSTLVRRIACSRSRPCASPARTRRATDATASCFVNGGPCIASLPLLAYPKLVAKGSCRRASAPSGTSRHSGVGFPPTRACVPAEAPLAAIPLRPRQSIKHASERPSTAPASASGRSQSLKGDRAQAACARRRRASTPR